MAFSRGFSNTISVCPGLEPFGDRILFCVFSKGVWRRGDGSRSDRNQIPHRSASSLGLTRIFSIVRVTSKQIGTSPVWPAHPYDSRTADSLSSDMLKVPQTRPILMILGSKRCVFFWRFQKSYRFVAKRGRLATKNYFVFSDGG